MNRYDVYEDGKLVAANVYHWTALNCYVAFPGGKKIEVKPSAYDAKGEAS